MPRWSSVGLSRKRLTAAYYATHGPIEAARRQRHDRGSRRAAAFRSKTSPHRGTDRPYLTHFDAKLPGNLPAEPVHGLSRLVDRQLSVTPGSRGREQLDGIVGLRR